MLRKRVKWLLVTGVSECLKLSHQRIVCRELGVRGAGRTGRCGGLCRVCVPIWRLLACPRRRSGLWFAERAKQPHTAKTEIGLLKKRKASFINWTQRAPIWAPAERLGRRLAATAATAAGQQGLCTRVTLRIVHIGTARTTRAAERCSR